jgi:hypothetical protein
MNELFLGIIALLLAAIGYFIKRILNKSDVIGDDVADMKPKVNVLWKDVADMKPKVDVLWADKYAPAHSPRQLNDRGNNILKESGIKEIVDEKKSKLLQIAKDKNPKNPYDAEIFITQIMSELPVHCPEVVEQLKGGAFKTGVDIKTVLFVGSVYLRDLIFPDLGFSVSDLDRSTVPMSG